MPPTGLPMRLTMVLVTHDMNVAKYADRVVHLLDGQIQRIESAAERDGYLGLQAEEVLP